MTYLEKITYLTGNFIQLCQFTLKNAFRFTCLLENKNKETNYTKQSDAGFVMAENKAKDLIVEYTFKGSDEILSYLSDKGLSTKDFQKLTFILKKRDYVVSAFYLDNANQIATEEIAVYVSKINELQEYCDKAIELNQALAKECDRLY